MDLLNVLKNSFATIQPQDIVDVLLVAFLFYKVVMLFKDTSGMQVMRGVILLLVATQIASWLGFNVLYFILSSTLQLGIIALVIVFQPDLRNMLEQMGRKSSSIQTILRQGKSGGADRTRAAAVITEACLSLSIKKIGALIVLERETALGDIMKTGTMINAVVSAELIENIFFPNSPLHDGAMIVHNAKIASAACFLPLSKNDRLSRELGTRHRAAVGVSEMSDALAVVVSEETGSISVADGGMLKRHLSGETLLRILENAMTAGMDTRNSKPWYAFWRKNKNA